MRLISLLLIIVSILALVRGDIPFEGQPPYSYVRSSREKGVNVLIDVPEDISPTVVEVGFQMWIKASYSYPEQFNYPSLESGYPGIAFLSDGTFGACSVEKNHRFLALWMAKSDDSQTPKFHCSVGHTKNSDDVYQMEFPGKIYDYDHSWNLISFSYSYNEQKAVFLTQFGYSQKIEKFEWNVIKNAASKLRFQLGNCNQNQQNSFQGWYHDVNFSYSQSAGSASYIDSEQLLLSYSSQRQQPKPALNNYQRKTIINGIQKFSAKNNKQTFKTVFKGLNGPTEYAVYGWAKWDKYCSERKWHSFFRLSSKREADIQDYKNVGDRTLSGFVKKGLISIQSHDQNYRGGRKPYVYKNINISNEWNNWFFVYMAYSYELQKTVTYIKFQDKEETFDFDNQYHYLQDEVTFYLGKDPFYPAFNGNLKNWNVEFGKGSFRQTNYDELYNKSNYLDQTEITLSEPSTPEPQLYNIGHTDQKSPYVYQVPDSDLANVQDVSYSYWFRFNYFSDDQPVDIKNLRNGFQIFSGLSENDKCKVGLGNRKMTIFSYPQKNGKVALAFTTYDTVSQNYNKYEYVELEDDKDLDSSWNFLYYGYSQETQMLSLYLKFSNSNSIVFRTFGPFKHQSPPKGLTFRLGHCSDQDYSQLNGHFWNPRFYYTGRNYLGTKEAVDFLFSSSAQPKKFLPMVGIKSQKFIYGETQFDGNSKETKYFGPVVGVSGATEYCVYGWAKYNEESSNNVYTVFRLSDWDENQLQNGEKYGDRDLILMVYQNQLWWATYTLGIQGGNDSWDLIEKIDNEEDIDEYFWFYLGYSSLDNQVHVFVQYSSGEIYSKTLSNIRHALPQKPYVYMKSPFYRGFNGSIYQLVVSHGEGSYQTKGYEELQKVDQNQTQFKQDNVWDEDPVLEDSYADDQKWEEIIADNLSGVDSYSFSAYVKSSLADPERQPLSTPRDGWQGIIGITENDEFDSSSNFGDRTLCLFDRKWSEGAGYRFATYAKNAGSSNYHLDVLHDDQDIDSSWNWVYFGYSHSKKYAQGLIIYGRTRKIYYVYFENIEHLGNPSKLKLIYGHTGKKDSKFGFHGQFYDVRFRYDSQSFKPNWQAAYYYWQNSVPAALPMDPLARVIPLTNDKDIVEVKQNESLKETHQKHLPLEFRGATEYATWGWAKWDNVETRKQNNILFRVTTNEPSAQNNEMRLGDRSLLCYVEQGNIVFATYTFNYQNSNADTSVLQQIPYGNSLQQWFFVYFGYSFYKREAQVIIKFSDRIEKVVFDNFTHFIPKHFSIYLGKDHYFPAFNGQLQYWFFSAGKGSYIDGDIRFEQIYKQQEEQQEEYVDSNVDLNGLIGSSEELVHQKQQFLGPKQIITNKSELSKIDTYGYWLWVRWSFKNPGDFGKVSGFQDKCFSIARAVLKAGSGLLTRLCVDKERSVYFEFEDTYAKVISRVEIPDAIKYLFDKWIWIYYIHSSVTNENIAFMYFAESENTAFQIQKNVIHPSPIPKFQFKLGGRHIGEHVWNGYFYDTEYTFKSSSWLSDFDNQIGSFIQKNSNKVPVFNEKLIDSIVYYKMWESGTIQVQSTQYNRKLSQFHIRDFSNIDEYAVFGWAKLSQDAFQHQNNFDFLFRLTTIEKEKNQNFQNCGDRTFGFWIHKDGYMWWTTYDYNYPKDSNPKVTAGKLTDAPKVTPQQLQNEFFVYAAYSGKQNNIYIYVEFYDGGIIEVDIEEITHLPSSYFALYLGDDYADIEGYNQFEGTYYYWGLLLGRGSFSKVKEEMFRYKTIASSKYYQVEEQQFEDDSNEQSKSTDQLCDTNESKQNTGDQSKKEDQDIEEKEDDNEIGVKPDKSTDDSEKKICKDESGNVIDCELMKQFCYDARGIAIDCEEDSDDFEFDNNPPEPQGGCVILYSQCGFKGDWENICEDNPKVYIDVQSVYVPEGLKIKLFNLAHFNGKTAVFHRTVECIDELNFQLLQKSGIQIFENKRAALISNFKGMSFVAAKLIKDN